MLGLYMITQYSEKKFQDLVLSWHPHEKVAITSHQDMVDSLLYSCRVNQE
jgi:hypothetical protein